MDGDLKPLKTKTLSMFKHSKLESCLERRSFYCPKTTNKLQCHGKLAKSHVYKSLSIVMHHDNVQ